MNAAPPILLDDIIVSVVPDADPPVFLIRLAGILSGTDVPSAVSFAVSAEGMGALAAEVLRQGPTAPGFNESLMARLALPPTDLVPSRE